MFSHTPPEVTTWLALLTHTDRRTGRHGRDPQAGGRACRDIIEWFDDTCMTLAWRFSALQQRNQERRSLIVREGQKAVLVHAAGSRTRSGPATMS